MEREKGEERKEEMKEIYGEEIEHTIKGMSIFQFLSWMNSQGFSQVGQPEFLISMKNEVAYVKIKMKFRRWEE